MSFDFSFPPHLKELREHARCVAIKGALDFGSFDDFKSEFTDIAHTRGVLSAARSAAPNSANSQFFICFQAAPFLDRNYTVFGKVIKGIEFVMSIKRGDGPNGSVSSPDKIISFKSK